MSGTRLLPVPTPPLHLSARYHTPGNATGVHGDLNTDINHFKERNLLNSNLNDCNNVNQDNPQDNPPNETSINVSDKKQQDSANHKLSIMTWNIQGIGSKLSLNSVQTLFSKYDIIFLIETMKLDSFDPNLKDYQYYHCQRSYKHPKARRPSGGIAVLINKSISPHIKIEKMTEYVIWLRVQQWRQPAIYLGGIYIPPQGSKSYLNSDPIDIYNELQKDLAKFLNNSPLIALCGDFNSRVGNLRDFEICIAGKDSDLITNLNEAAINKCKSDSKTTWHIKNRHTSDKTHNSFGKDLIQLCKASGMRIINGLLNPKNTDNFTCHAPLGKSVVDYLLCTRDLFNLLTDFEIYPKLVESDHTPLTYKLDYEKHITESRPTCNVNKRNTPKQERRFHYLFEKERIPIYKNMLRNEQNILAEAVDHILKQSNSDTLINSVYIYLEACIEPNFKKKYVKAPINNFPSNPWYDEECKNARKTANSYAKLNNLSNAAHNEQYKVLYKNYKSTIQRKKREHLKANRDKLDQLHHTNQTECWKMWNKLTNHNNKSHEQPSIQVFHEYFKNQAQPPPCDYFDTENMDEINSFVSIMNCSQYNNPAPESMSEDICDKTITENEVVLHMTKLKNNKAAGVDGIPGEFYKYVTDELVTPFCAIFNYIFDSGDYPSQWAEGLINALHKKGDCSNPDNYRKITITVTMAKIFDSILNARLYFKNDAMSLDDPFQFGFTPTRRTTDCVFVLDTITRHQQFHKKPTYLCFVDFSKAFDYINRNALYLKLRNQKMGRKMLTIIMSMFDKAKAKVHHQGDFGEAIDSIFGVLQGGVLSPKLFNEYMSDLHTQLNVKDGIEIDNTYFTHLLYADDIVLISDSAEGLQNNIDSLHRFCAKWHLLVNITKTKVMQIGRKRPLNFIYNNQIIENVETYKYLGHIVSSNKFIHNKMPEHLITQAQKALFALQNKTKSSFGFIPPHLAIKMFDTYILPILEYNDVLWSKTSQILDMEKIQLGYLKNVLGVRRQTSTLAIYAETGRFPLHIRQKVNTVNYWARLASLPEYDILHKCLNIQESLHARGQTNWCTHVRNIIEGICAPQMVLDTPKSLATQVKIKIYSSEQSRILDEIKNSDKQPKLRTYKLFKTSYSIEPYLLINLPKKTINNIARFRLSSHNLKIETGRHQTPKVPVENRICDKCTSSEVEDEIHFIVTCSSNKSLRDQLFQKAKNFIPEFENLNTFEKFKALLNCREPKVIHALGDFLNKCM